MKSRASLVRVAMPRASAAPSRFRLAVPKDSLWHRGHDRSDAFDSGTEDFDEEGEEIHEAPSPEIPFASPVASVATLEPPENGTLPRNYEEVYGTESNKRMRWRFWSKNTGNILYATRRLPVGAAQLLDSNMAHKLGDKEDVYKLVREAYGIDDDAQYE
mmetsp:Transcript_22950/g.52604  ORF Transcript_22950/g.52604 Transcript_22950/m.52604 type:complete len:159 (+) Transcript_22950:77-553(+)